MDDMVNCFIVSITHYKLCDHYAEQVNHNDSTGVLV